MRLLTTEWKVRYKSRDPDPGVCRVISCDWERGRLSVSNGRCTYFPGFDEVEEVPSSEAPSPRAGEEWVRNGDETVVEVTDVSGNYVYILDRSLPERQVPTYVHRDLFRELFHKKPQPAAIIPTYNRPEPGQTWALRNYPGGESAMPPTCYVQRVKGGLVWFLPDANSVEECRERTSAEFCALYALQPTKQTSP